MIRVTLTNVLPDSVFNDEEASDMTDAEIVQLFQDDCLDVVIDGASWTIERGVK